MTTETKTTTARRRARKIRVLGLLAGVTAIVAMIPSGASASTKVVKEDAWMQYQPPTSGVTPFLFGGLGNSKPVCRHDRVIDIYRSTDQIDWDYTWHSEESADAGTTVYLNNNDRGYYYTLVVERKKIVKPSGQKVLCSGGFMYDSVYAS